MTSEDVKKIKSFELPGMTLLGFRSRDFLKPYYQIRPSYFVYPDETRVKGSS